ncbi:hypothetical protein I4U23_024728 [Adineta vaga]|nr:hypothetical protein I4U23_024728 [Adineta vaga]
MSTDCCQSEIIAYNDPFINSPLQNPENNATIQNQDDFFMKNFTDLMANNSQNSFSNFIQIPVFTFIIIFTSIYTALVISPRTPRTTKFTWLTINVCLASAFFALNQLIFIGFRLNNTAETLVTCRSKGFILNMITCHIMYSHCISSICRLLSICYPQKPLFKSRHWILSNICMSWIIAIVIALPYLFLDSFTCSGDKGRQFLKIYTLLLIILLPIITVALCNITIFRYIRQSTKRIHSFSENMTNNKQFSKRDISICKIMLLTFCVFVIGWAPLFIQQVFFNQDFQYRSNITIFFQILSATSLLADIILLIYSDQPIRRILFNLVRCR